MVLRPTKGTVQALLILSLLAGTLSSAFAQNNAPRSSQHGTNRSVGRTARSRPRARTTGAYPRSDFDTSEGAFKGELNGGNYEMAGLLLGQRAADYWSSNQFPPAMRYFKEFGVYAEPFMSINPLMPRDELIRQSLVFKDMAKRYTRFMYNTFAVRQALCNENNCSQLAWEMAEHLKSRLFRREVLKATLNNLDGVRREKVIRLINQAWEVKLQRMLWRGGAGEYSNPTRYDQQVMNLEAEISGAMPEYKYLATTMVTPQQLLEVLAPDETLLSFFYSDNERAVYVWRVEQKTPPELIKLPVSTFDLLLRIDELRKTLQTGITLEQAAPQLAALSNVLLPPLRLEPNRRLIIIPDENLTALPFDILPWSASSLLMDAFRTTYMPSATVFYYLRKQKLISGPESYELNYFGAAFDGNGKSALDYANTEIENAAKWFPKAGIKIPDAHESELYSKRQLLGRAKYLLFSAHNDYAEDVVDDVYLVLGTGGGEDGRLTAEEIAARLRNHAEVTVLSACDTGPAKRAVGPPLAVMVDANNPANSNQRYIASGCVCQTGESFSSLASAFFAAGSKSLILTQWSIWDQPRTNQFIDILFNYLAQEKRPSEALYLAKQEMRRMKQLPVYWAGYLFMGD